MAGSFLALEAVVEQDDRVLARCLMRRGKYIIGHERKNEIVVDADSISGRHAQLAMATEEHFYLKDLGSANGTCVDGQPIEEEVAITIDSQITLGHARLTFQRGGLPASLFRHLPEHFFRQSRYEFGQVIIEGRTSTIYEARDTILQRRVAVKVLNRASLSNIPLVLAFIRENQIAAQLTHSGILPVYDFGLDEEIGLFSATRFIEGESLGELLSGMATGHTEAPQASLYSLLNIFLRACDIVAYANTAGVIHGCLHPEAIIFGRFGEVFIDHWGTATIGAPREPDRPQLQAPAVSAPPPISRCVAPEQATDARNIDARADVYALGAILFRILTLRNFNNGESDAEIVAKVIRPKATPAEAFATSAVPAHIPGGVFPERLAAICASALSFNREERVVSAHNLKLAVAHWLEHNAGGGGNGVKKKASVPVRH